jgi:hypothetical protein
MDANSSSLAVELAAAMSFLLFAGTFWAVSSLGQCAIAPIDRSVAIGPRAPARFCLSELLLLAVEIQFAAAISMWLARGDVAWAIAACALSVGGLAAMWWRGLQRLARCGVACQRRRAALLGIVAPATCSAIAAGLWFNGRAVLEIAATGELSPAPWLAGNAAAMVAFIACRRLTLWVERESPAAFAPAQLRSPRSQLE